MSDTKAKRTSFPSLSSEDGRAPAVRTETREHTRLSLSKRINRRHVGIISTALVFIVGTVLVVAFFHVDRRGDISRLIQQSGGLGIILSIVLMALFCVIPVPAEFLLILDMKVFGVWWGVLYSWVGTMVGCIGVFLLARYVASGLLRSFIPNDRMEQVSEWVGKRGVVGLLLAHVIPLPFIVVNYVAGIIPSVRLWDFIWTSAVGGVPYYLGAALVFLGMSTKYIVWAVIGLVALSAIWIGGFLYNRHVNRLKRWAH